MMTATGSLLFVKGLKCVVGLVLYDIIVGSSTVFIEIRIVWCRLIVTC